MQISDPSSIFKDSFDEKQMDNKHVYSTPNFTPTTQTDTSYFVLVMFSLLTQGDFSKWQPYYLALGYGLIHCFEPTTWLIGVDKAGAFGGSGV